MKIKIDLTKYGYYSLRTVMMAVSLLLLLAWAVFGFDSTIDNLFTVREGAEGVGFHYSTLQGMVFLFYVSLINFEVGGIKSFKQLLDEVKSDLLTFKHLFQDRDYLVHLRKGNELLDYKYAFVYSACLALFALFVFEFPYVLMLNYFQYSNLLFPIYYYEGFPFSTTLIRNILGVLLIPVVLILFKSGLGAKLRWDKRARFFILITIISFGLWVGMPSEQNYKGRNDINITLDGPILTWPKQQLFPQTIYVYLNASIDDPVHQRNDLDGWYQEDNYVHAVNVLAKYFVFLSVGYIFIIKVKEK